MPWHSKPPTTAPVYRCGDHWHFEPTRKDRKLWYREKEASVSPIPPLHPSNPKSLLPFYEGKFETYAYPVYAQGHGDEEFVVTHKYASGFYVLGKPDRNSHDFSRCQGLRQYDDNKLWRVEEISRTPWGRPHAVNDEAVYREAVHDEGVNDEPLPSYQYRQPYQEPYQAPQRAPHQAPPSYEAPHRATPAHRASYHAPPSYEAPHRATPAHRASYHVPPSNQTRPSHYSARYQYEQ